MTTAELTSTALVVTATSSRVEIETILRDMGYSTVHVGAKDALRGLADPVSLCLIDLRENGDAVRIARAIRAQQPQAVVIGVADPDRPSTAADAIRAGVFDVLPRPPSARDLEALIANAREQAALASNGSPRPHESLPYGIVGSSPAMRTVIDLAQRAASARCGYRAAVRCRAARSTASARRRRRSAPRGWRGSRSTSGRRAPPACNRRS